MTPCAHIWIPLAEDIENCHNCGAVRSRPRRPTPLSQAERDKRRPLPPEILADALQDGAGPPLGRVLRVVPIPTTTIHGDPTNWPPITEKEETHD